MSTDIVRKLAEARKEAEAKAAKKKAMLDAFLNSDDYAIAAEDAKVWEAHVERLESTLRAEALGQYAHDQNKKGQGYEIKDETIVTILDTHAVTAWCIHNFTPALSLNEKMIKTAAKNNSVPEGLVSITTQPKVYIKTDLSEYL